MVRQGLITGWKDRNNSGGRVLEGERWSQKADGGCEASAKERQGLERQ